MQKNKKVFMKKEKKKQKKKLNEEDTTIAMPFTLKKECTHNASHECLNSK